jgi:hypothetical protein
MHELRAIAAPAHALAVCGCAIIVGRLCAPAGASLAGRPVPCGPRQPGQLSSVAGPQQAEHALCVWASRSSFGLWTVCFRNPFLFYSKFISDSNFENYETSSVGFIIL